MEGRKSIWLIYLFFLLKSSYNFHKLFENSHFYVLYTWQLCRKYFSLYAETCFKNFGDRVKNWITINEPIQTAVNGYGLGIFAPGRNENSLTEPYLASHHQLLAHAAAYSVYQSKYKVYCNFSVQIISV